jgi:xanthine dehydrogenase accessory factor
MREILDQVVEQLEAGRAFALLTLVSESGSTPRAAGAQMLVRDDGSIAGTIGGGLLEATMMREAADALRERRSRVTTLDLTGDDVSSAEKMVCGGTAQVSIARVSAGDRALLEICREIKHVVSDCRRAWFFMTLPSDEVGEVGFCLLGEEGSIRGGTPCDPASLRGLAGEAVRHGTAILPDGRAVIVEAIEPPFQVIICGAGHVGAALVPVARCAGFAPVVLDDRPEFADPERFPEAESVATLRSFDDAFSGLKIGPQTYVVIVTRGHTHDLTVLRQALRTEAGYIGLMGSRTKRKRIYDALRADGFGDGDLDRVHLPIGLAIGAETPGELAVSIVAEMIRVRADAA